LSGRARVCLAGATGWVGRGLAPAIAAAPDLELSGAVSRTQAGRTLAEALGDPKLPSMVVHGTVADALEAGADVFVDYTSAAAVKKNVAEAIARGAHVVVGSSGLSDAEYAEIDRAARERGVGVLAAGNFALTAVLLQRFAEMAARLIPQWEVVEYARSSKPDAPSGTARELAGRLGRVRRPEIAVPIEKTLGAPEARGASLSGTPVHSVRLPGFVSSIEVLFGLPDERLAIRHDSGSGAEPYIAGTLLAIRRVGGFTGLKRGLDSVMEL
jgi:4-hydroxy-tetrahydrodipicolinate reductase